MPKLSDYVIQFVADQGVKHVFLVTGGGAMHLNESLGHCSQIESVCNSHEQASAIAAENYGKATNRLGVALVTTGPGGTNAVTGVVGAWLDSTPCLFISGQVKRPDRMFDAEGRPLGMRQLGVQEVDIVSIVKPVTKYAVTVLDPQSIRYHLEKAVHIATTGRPGPVWVDIPLDVQASPIEIANLKGFDAAELAPPVSDSDLPKQVAEVIAALNRSERPLLFAGNGIRLARAEREFSELIRLLKIPVVATWLAADLLSSDDPLFVGRPGSVAARGANFALQNCDLLLALGVRLDFPITGYAPDKLARAAHKVLVDIDPAELAKLNPYIQAPICADAGAFLREFLKERDSVAQKQRCAWDARCADWKTRYSVITEEHRKPEGPVSIYHLAEVIGRETRPDDLLISGSSGSGIEIFLLACPTRTGQRIFHTAGLGAMGFGLPGSIGLCLAGGRRRTVCVDGDGGFQFNIQELETVARLNLPIKFFVLNNDGYASIRASQSNYFGQASIGCDARTGLTVPNIPKVAASYGLATAIIENQSDLRRDVKAILDTPGPVVCDVHVIPDEVRAPRLSSMQRPDGSFVSKPLEDLWPFLPREEFFANMIVEPLPE
ncbi:MAG: thiamine pyrophosphate-binding protein [Acidobacteriaceae bacterium]|nr:thiamine pyrophosphate-binding protein [Acidobacteriaceae bacterium]MBV9765831.1 thiamine pyrophosphate-binding protein [Acidobacteriaceae bacterium]